jgi:hypothetical protein
MELPAFLMAAPMKENTRPTACMGGLYASTRMEQSITACLVKTTDMDRYVILPFMVHSSVRPKTIRKRPMNRAFSLGVRSVLDTFGWPCVTFRFTYSCPFVRFQLSIHRVTWPYDDEYDGEWKSEQIHGRGVYKFDNGQKSMMECLVRARNMERCTLLPFVILLLVLSRTQME